MPAKLVEKSISILRSLALPACLVALAALSWLPAKAVARTSLGGHVEHLIAYLVTATVVGLTLWNGPRLSVQCGLLILYAAVLEAGQIYAPGRHASLQDLAFSSTGVILGGLLLWMVRAVAMAQRPTGR